MPDDALRSSFGRQPARGDRHRLEPLSKEEQEQLAQIAVAFFSNPAIQSMAKQARDFIDARVRPLVQQLQLALKPAIDGLIAMAPMLEELSRQLQPVLERALLPNWRGVQLRSSDNERLREILLNEAIPLAWVPPAPVIRLLLEAEDAQTRRRIIGGRWRSLTKDAIGQFELVEVKSVAGLLPFAREAADALLNGYPAASQALSSNLLDTLLRAYLDETNRAKLTGRKRTRPDLDALSYRQAIVQGGLFGAFGTFDGRNGEPPPRFFSRHGAAHGVSKRQYSKINAVLALMHVAALMRAIDAGVRMGE